MCSETRASRLFGVLAAATLPQTLFLVIPLNYISEPCPSVPLPPFSSSSETAQRPHYSYASKSVPLTVFRRIWTASCFVSYVGMAAPLMSVSWNYFLNLCDLKTKPNQTKKTTQRDSCSFIIQDSISCLPGACLLQKETIRNGDFPILQNPFQTPMVWF